MSEAGSVAPNELRILVLTAGGRDSQLACEALEEADLHCRPCIDLVDLCDRVTGGAGAAVVALEALRPPSVAQRLADALDDQPAWSSMPLVILMGSRQPGQAQIEQLRRLEPLRQVTFLERPVRRVTLVTTVRAALDARQRQYQLRDLLERLEEGVRSRDRFLATLGHELRNPLGAMRSAVDLLHRVTSIDRRLITAREILGRQCDHIGRLLDDLLDVSRIRTDQIRLHRERVELAELVRDAVDIVEPEIESRQHVLDVHLPGEEVWLDADATRIRQILSNLLDNAAKYTEPGGHVSLRAEVGPEGEEVVVRVRDDGIGMSAEELSRAFDRFRHGEGRLERETGGLGLGLTIARRLVEMHGGTLQAHSDGPGKGSELVLRLPRASPPDREPASQGTERSRAAEPVAGARSRRPGGRAGQGGNGAGSGARERPLKVLLVEDNRDLAEALGSLLVGEGYEVRICRNGTGALRMADELRPDVVLLDIGLPDVDGYEVARRLREQRGLEDALLVAVTGYGQDDDRRRSEGARIDRHLVKPVQLDALREILEGVETLETRGEQTA